MGGFFHKSITYSLASKFLMEHLELMGVLNMYGITIGIGFSLFFGNFLYKVSGNNMITPHIVFIVMTLLLQLPLAIKVIPDDRKLEI